MVRSLSHSPLTVTVHWRQGPRTAAWDQFWRTFFASVPQLADTNPRTEGRP
jgi:hypothetical protein